MPTPAHFFMRLLHEKGLLLTIFTQNIDGLEQLAGLPAEKVVPAHGSFDGECLWLDNVLVAVALPTFGPVRSASRSSAAVVFASRSPHSVVHSC